MKKTQFQRTSWKCRPKNNRISRKRPKTVWIKALHCKHRPQNNHISWKRPKIVSKYFMENVDNRTIESHEKGKKSIKAVHGKCRQQNKRISWKRQKQYQSTSRNTSTIEQENKMNKMCLWNTNVPDNGQFQRWWRSQGQIP